MKTFLKTIQDGASAFFCGPFVYASSAFCEVTGWEQCDLLGKDLEALLHASSAPEDGTDREIHLRHAATSEPIPARVYLIDTPSDSPRLGFVMLQKQTVPSLFLDAEALHDIRNPLNTILGYGRIFEADEQFPPKYRQGTDSIIQAAETIQSRLGGKGVSDTAPIPDAISAKEGKEVKVLIVDDDIDNRTVLGLFLKKEPLSLLFANDGASAYATAVKERPDLIFMDLHMPDMDGWEAAEKIKKTLPDTKIAALTADLLAVEEENGSTLVFDRKLHKPFDRKEVRETITALTGMEFTVRQQTSPQPLPDAGMLPRTLFEGILANIQAGHISSLEALISECSEPEIRHFLTERLERFDLDGLSRWAEGCLRDGK